MTSEERLALMYQGYTEALVWAEIPLEDEQDKYDDRSLEDRGYCASDFNADAMIDIRFELMRLDRLMAEQSIIVPCDAWWQVGADLYFTRQHHGVGFWDRPDIYGKVNAERLTDLTDKNFSETYAWIDGGNRIAVETYIPRRAQ